MVYSRGFHLGLLTRLSPWSTHKTFTLVYSRDFHLGLLTRLSPWSTHEAFTLVYSRGFHLGLLTRLSPWSTHEAFTLVYSRGFHLGLLTRLSPWSTHEAFASTTSFMRHSCWNSSLLNMLTVGALSIRPVIGGVVLIRRNCFQHTVISLTASVVMMRWYIWSRPIRGQTEFTPLACRC